MFVVPLRPQDAVPLAQLGHPTAPIDAEAARSESARSVRPRSWSLRRRSRRLAAQSGN
jgi:hypothetical protein